MTYAVRFSKRTPHTRVFNTLEEAQSFINELAAEDYVSVMRVTVLRSPDDTG
jgi:hypothetical protein